MDRPIRLRRPMHLVLAASLAVFLVPGLVAAHAELVTASPAAGSTVTQPVAEVSGVYSEAMTPNGSSILVKDASGATVIRGTVDPARNTRMVATRAAPLGSGTYTVAWTSVALDGHLMRGTWTFTVAVPVASTPPSSTPAGSGAASAGPTVVGATPSPSTGQTPLPSAGGGTPVSGTSDVVLPILVALMILGAGAAYLLRRRNRPPGLT